MSLRSKPLVLHARAVMVDAPLRVGSARKPASPTRVMVAAAALQDLVSV